MECGLQVQHNPDFEQQRQGDYREAEILFRTGADLYSRDQKEDALLTFRKVLDLRPGHKDARYNLGRVLMELERFEEAAEEFRLLLVLDRYDLEAQFYLGTALEMSGRLEEAVECYEFASSIAPELLEPRIKLGTARISLGLWEQALDDFRFLLLNNLDDADIHFCIGLAHQGMNNIEMAVNAYETAITRSDEHEAAFMQLARLKLETGQSEEAGRLAERILSLNPYNSDAIKILGETLQSRGALPEAIDLYTRALDFDDHFMNSLEDIFKKMILSQDIDNAFSVLNKISAQSTKFKNRMEQESEKVHQARGLLENPMTYAWAAVKDSGNIKAWQGLVYALLKLNAIDEAEYCLEKILALDQFNIPALRSLAELCVRRADLDKAAEYYYRLRMADKSFVV